jgi:hypothetical protein
MVTRGNHDKRRYDHSAQVPWQNKIRQYRKTRDLLKTHCLRVEETNLRLCPSRHSLTFSPFVHQWHKLRSLVAF